MLILALLGALYGLAVLSCTIACNGYGVLAVVLMVGGGYLVSFLTVLGITNAFRRESQRNDSMIKKSLLAALIIVLSLTALLLLIGAL